MKVLSLKLLDGHEIESYLDRLAVRKKRAVCANVGHLWYLRSYDPSTGETVLECRRCFPHRDSIQRGKLYDPFEIPNKPQEDSDDA